jgi:hypothetical protein
MTEILSDPINIAVAGVLLGMVLGFVAGLITVLK